MNMSYKSIWNESLGAWVAASEATQTSGKKSKSLLGLLACAGLVLGSLAPMQAAQAAGLISPCTGASLPKSAIIGVLDPLLNPLVTGVDTLTLGTLGLGGIYGNLAVGNPIALNVLDTQGNVLSANQDCNVVANEYSLNTPAGVAIGGNKITGLGAQGGTPAVARELTAVALGNGANTAAGATNAVALGENASVLTTAPNSVALGANSVANMADTISVGQLRFERRIVNVAAGIADTDAANVGQVKAFGAMAGNSVQYDNVGKTGVTLGGAGTVVPVALGNVAAGALTSTSTDAVNGGQLFATNGNVSTNTTNIAGNTTSISNLTTNITQGKIGLVQQTGPGANLTVGGGTGGAAINVLGTDGDRRIINVATGIADTDAANVGQVKAIGSMAGNSVQYDNVGKTSVTLGGAGAIAPVGLGNVAAGALTSNSTEAVNGAQLSATNTNVANLDGRVTTNTTNIAGNTTAVTGLTTNITQGKIGLVQQAAPGANLTIGSSTNGAAIDVMGSGGTRQIINVAAGVNDTDAANVGQVRIAGALAGNSVQYDNVGKTSITLGGAGALVPVALGNVAAGALTSTSSDAVNGAQLAATNTIVTNVAGDTSAPFTTANGKGIRYARTNETGLPATDAFAQGAGSTALGYNATASAENSIAVGRDAQATAADSVAIGRGAVAKNGRAVSIGLQNTASGNGAVAIGDPNVATGTGAVAVGKDNTASGQGAFASGNANIATGAGSVAIGDMNKATGQASIALGSNAFASGLSSVALGQASQASAANSVALGAGAVAVRGAQTGYAAAALGTAQNSAGEVSVGSAGRERQVTNVAPGSAGTDAVNVNQLNVALGGMGGPLSNVNNRIDDVEKNADAGTAGAMAMAGMPQAYTPGKSVVAAGAATYQGQTSIAVGVSTLSDNGKWVVKLNGSANSRGKVGMAVGAGYQW